MNAQKSKNTADFVKRKYPAVAVMVECFVQGIFDESIDLPCHGEELEIAERLKSLLKIEAKRINDAYDSLGLTWKDVTLTPDSQKFINEAILIASFNSGGDDGWIGNSGPH